MAVAPMEEQAHHEIICDGRVLPMDISSVEYEFYNNGDVDHITIQALQTLGSTGGFEPPLFANGDLSKITRLIVRRRGYATREIDVICQRMTSGQSINNLRRILLDLIPTGNPEQANVAANNWRFNRDSFHERQRVSRGDEPLHEDIRSRNMARRRRGVEEMLSESGLQLDPSWTYDPDATQIPVVDIQGPIRDPAYLQLRKGKPDIVPMMTPEDESSEPVRIIRRREK